MGNYRKEVTELSKTVIDSTALWREGLQKYLYAPEASKYEYNDRFLKNFISNFWNSGSEFSRFLVYRIECK